MPIIVDGGGNGGGSGGAIITSAVLNEDGHLIFTYDDGRTSDTGALLTEDQLDALENAVTSTDFGDHLELDDDGKFVPVMEIHVGNEEHVSNDGVFTLPIASRNATGLVKLSDEFTIDANGDLSIEKLDVQKLYIKNGDELIIGG